MRTEISIIRLNEVLSDFDNVLSGLKQSDFTTFVKNLKVLVDYCERTVPISFIVKSFANADGMQFDKWYKDWDFSGSPGKKYYEPIHPGEIGSAMIYEFLKRIIIGEVDLRRFCQETMSLRANGPMKRYLNFYDHFINRLADDIKRKLGDLTLGQQKKEYKRKDISDRRWSKTAVIATISLVIIALLTLILGILKKI